MSRESKIYVLSDGSKVAKDRSVGVVLLAVTIVNGKQIMILCNKRGKTTSEEKLKWNLPSGYLNWDENGAEAAQRECFEECGCNIPLERIVEIEHSTEPTENKQNVIFRYCAILTNDQYLESLKSLKPQDEKEVSCVAWLKYEDIISNYKDDFAWNQIETIKRMLTKMEII